MAPLMPDNPHVHFFESSKRGYVCVDLERNKMTTRMRAVSDAHDPQAGISTLKTFVVEDGKPGPVEA
jgi:alkaline phosphatase D